uniref:ATP synthase subunit 9, mitochondrial n=1 Tax=Acavomonas peruviana TaxID=1542312 RepID=V5KWI3_9ALVE|nr:ATP synthase F0 subunit 9 [Acavomonas peruviana]
MKIYGLNSVGAGTASSGLLGAAIGIGIIFASLMMSTSKNSKRNLQSQYFSYAMLGFALVESIALFLLMMSLLILYS